MMLTGMKMRVVLFFILVKPFICHDSDGYETITTPLHFASGRDNHECILRIEQPVYSFYLNLTTEVPTTLLSYNGPFSYVSSSMDSHFFHGNGVQYPPKILVWVEFSKEKSKIEGICYWDVNYTLTSQITENNVTSNVTTLTAGDVTKSTEASTSWWSNENSLTDTTVTNYTTVMTTHDTNQSGTIGNNTMSDEQNATDTENITDSRTTRKLTVETSPPSGEANTKPTNTNPTSGDLNEEPETSSMNPTTKLPNTTDDVNQNVTSTTTVVTSEASTAPCLCQCPCKPTDPKEMEANLEAMIKSLQIQKNSTGLAKRKKMSASDKRWISRGIGCVGILVLTVVFGLLIAGDAKLFIRDAKVMINDVRGRISRRN